MNREKITILFVINTNKTNEKGLCPLSCRITLNKERKQFTTGLFVNPNYWENKLQKKNYSRGKSQIHKHSIGANSSQDLQHCFGISTSGNSMEIR